MRFSPGRSRLRTSPALTGSLAVKTIGIVAVVHFDGDPRSHERPLHGVIDALKSLGARIDDDGRGTLPLTVHGAGALDGGPVSVDASSSSQFVSALLLSGARFNQGVEVRHTGATLPSLPHIRMTVDMLRAAGAQVDTPESGGEANVWRVTPGALLGREAGLAWIFAGSAAAVLGWLPLAAQVEKRGNKATALSR